MNLAEEVKKVFKGEILADEKSLELYSHDTSLFKVKPKLVVYPKDKEDLSNLIEFVSEHKKEDPTLSVTMRSAGSDMSGGPLNESIIADVTKHLNKIGEIREEGTLVEPGVFYRDFEPRTLAQDLILPCYPASKNLCALGGMVNNNCAGEKTLRYGKMENFIKSAQWIFSDGRSYEIKPLNKSALEQKIAQNDFEGNLYKQVFELIEQNQKVIQEAKPHVSKNSAGYYLWNVWDGETFDLNKLLVGSQGTLGALVEANVSLTPVKKHHDLVSIFFNSWEELPKVVSAILPYEPESLETFDKDTLKLGIRFMPEIAKKAHTNLFSFAAKFLPEALIGVRMGGLPELVILVEMAEETEDEVKKKVREIEQAIKPLNVFHRVIEKDGEEEKFWIMRRESFNLLRQHVAGKRTVPLVEDFCIPVEKVPEFLPQAKQILEKYKIDVNIAGHAGNGNFHIIPLMDLKKESEREKLIPVANEFYTLVARYKGSITAEHNDGIVRTPYLHMMYSPEVLDLFKKVKEIFDPLNIFNPGKKVGGSLEYLKNHINID